MGAYELSDELVRDIMPTHTYNVREEIETRVPSEIKRGSTPLDRPGRGLCFPDGPDDRCGGDEDDEGDIRVYWEHFPEGPASLYAGLEGDTLVPFEHPDIHHPITRISRGRDSASAMFREAQTQSERIIWMIRAMILACLWFMGIFVMYTSSGGERKWPVVGAIDNIGKSMLVALVLTAAVVGSVMGLGWLLFGLIGL